MSNDNIVCIKKTDWLIIVILLLLPILSKVFFTFTNNKNQAYEVKTFENGKEHIEIISPNDSAVKKINGNSGYIILELDNEKGVRVASSTCPCKVCVNYGWTKYDSIVCVPNSIIIRPINSSNTLKDGIDAVTK